MSKRREHDDVNIDIAALIDATLPFAKQMIAQQGGFQPFGAFVNLDRKVEMLGAQPGNAQHTSRLLIQALKSVAHDGKCLTTIVCMDVRTVLAGQPEKTDAILGKIEDVGGEAIHYVVPYRKRPDGTVEYDKLFMEHGELDVFAKPGFFRRWFGG
jgi:hypothetical protein